MSDAEVACAFHCPPVGLVAFSSPRLQLRKCRTIVSLGLLYSIRALNSEGK